MPSSKLAVSLAIAGSIGAVMAERKITVTNNCDETIWPALFTSNGDKPSHATGWEAAKGATEVLSLPDNWNGRIWGRRQCDFSGGSTLPDTCASGGCNGGLECATEGGTGVPPVTLAEFNFEPADQDWYDLSHVDGSNLPASLKLSAGDCKSPSCTFDLNSECPDELKKKNGNGDTVGCLSACAANLDGNPADSPNCCSGSHDTPETCPDSGIAHYDYFHGHCPEVYYSAYDDEYALFTCPKGSNAEYTVTFCG